MVLGYDEDRAAGMFTSEGYPVSYDVGLKRALGDREVVDPAGDRIPECR